MRNLGFFHKIDKFDSMYKETSENIGAITTFMTNFIILIISSFILAIFFLIFSSNI